MIRRWHQAIAFYLRRWYWNQPRARRRLLESLPDWAAAIAVALVIAALAAKGF